VLVSSRLIWLLNADHIMIRTDLLRERSPGVAASCVLSSELLLCPRLVGWPVSSTPTSSVRACVAGAGAHTERLCVSCDSCSAAETVGGADVQR
jgi:hypothetical protein